MLPLAYCLGKRSERGASVISLTSTSTTSGVFCELVRQAPKGALLRQGKQAKACW